MTVKTAGGQWIPLVNRIMKSENVPKEIVKTFMDLVDMAKGLMDENQFNNRLFPNTRGRGREAKAESFIGLVLVNHLLLQQLIQILFLQHFLLQNGRLQKYGNQKLEKTPSKNAIFSM